MKKKYYIYKIIFSIRLYIIMNSKYNNFLNDIKGYDSLDSSKLKNLINKYNIDVDEYDKHELDLQEPILKETRKFTVFPIKYNKIWEMYKLQMACFWKAEDIDLSKDREDFYSLNEAQQHALKMVLAFFAASDGIVNFNLEKRFINEIKNTEILICYDFQKMMENIHSEVYSQMLDNIIDDKEEKDKLFNALNTIPSVKRMTDWAMHWIESKLPFPYRVIAFALVEGVFFSGAFALIFWFKSYTNKNGGEQKLKGLISSNEYIARDEGMHVDTACLIYSLCKNQLSQKEIYEIFDSAVDVACDFNNDALKSNLLGLSNEKMNNYTKYVADRLLVSLGYTKKYKVNNPLKYMETIGLLNKTNFFEDRPTDYQDSKIKNKKTNGKNKKKFIKRTDI